MDQPMMLKTSMKVKSPSTTTTTTTTTTTDTPTTAGTPETTTPEATTVPATTITTTANELTSTISVPDLLKKSSSRLQQSDLDERSPWKRPVPKVSKSSDWLMTTNQNSMFKT